MSCGSEDRRGEEVWKMKDGEAERKVDTKRKEKKNRETSNDGDIPQSHGSSKWTKEIIYYCLHS